VQPARHAEAHRRAQLAKGALASFAALTFVAGLALTRAHFASHQKRKFSALSAPKRFTDVVRRDLLAAGIMAPAEASADVSTSVS
jgi:hypothetical protein